MATGDDRKGEEARSRKPPDSSFRISVRTLMVLVATCSLVIWSARRVWEDATQNPYIRVLQNGTSADRRIAAGQLIGPPRPGEVKAVLSALILALGDADGEVRRASVQSLGE